MMIDDAKQAQELYTFAVWVLAGERGVYGLLDQRLQSHSIDLRNLLAQFIIYDIRIELIRCR